MSGIEIRKQAARAHENIVEKERIVGGSMAKQTSFKRPPNHNEFTRERGEEDEDLGVPAAAPPPHSAHKRMRHAAEDDEMPVEDEMRRFNAAFAHDDLSDVESSDEPRSSSRENARRPARGAANARGGFGCLDVAGADEKADKLLMYTGKDLVRTRLNTGDDIKDDEEEIRYLREVQERMQSAKKDKGKRMHDTDFLNDRYVNKDVRMGFCRICDHCSAAEMNSNHSKMDAIKAMNMFDIRFTGMIPDLVLFGKDADVFNNFQAKIAGVGGKVTMVTAREVRDHYRYHDLTNQFRPIIRQIYQYEELIDELQKQVVGINMETNRDVISINKVKLMNSLSNHRLRLQRQFTILRTEFLRNWNSDSIGGDSINAIMGSLTTGIGKAATGKLRSQYM